VLITSQDLTGPRNEVLGTLPGWLMGDPELEVLGAVVVPPSVLMVNVLDPQQRAANDPLHNNSML
jgi:hypothetical protein